MMTGGTTMTQETPHDTKAQLPGFGRIRRVPGRSADRRKTFYGSNLPAVQQ